MGRLMTDLPFFCVIPCGQTSVHSLLLHPSVLVTPSCVDGMTSVKTLSTVFPSSSSVSVAVEVGSAWDLGGAQRSVACGGVEGGSSHSST